MRVEIIVPSSVPGPHVPAVLSYFDERSRTVAEALERAWWVTNAAQDLLSDTEAAIRDHWDRLARGFSLDVGGHVLVDGQHYVCTSDGFRPG